MLGQKSVTEGLICVHLEILLPNCVHMPGTSPQIPLLSRINSLGGEGIFPN